VRPLQLNREGDRASIPDVAIVVVTYRRQALLAECLESIERAQEQVGSAELIVVDNGSRDGTSELIRERWPSARVVEIADNVGFTAAVSKGIALASARWVALFNDDVTIAPDALAALLAIGDSAPDVGSVAAQMRFARRPDTINSAGITVDSLGVAADRLVGAPIGAGESSPTEVFGVSGGAALYRREMLDDVGGFDVSFFAYLEDVDVAWRAHARGWRAFYAPDAVALHHHSATLIHGSPQKYFLVGRNRVRLLAKNATTSQLLRNGLAILAYDIGYVVYVAARNHTLAPLRGRLRGILDWPHYRRAGSPSRGSVAFAATGGFRDALRRHRVWSS
jgi:GT2 family glycosyltransferase